MRGMNKAMLIGRLGKDPESKQITSGKITRFSMATSESYKDSQGVKQESTEWHNIVCFGKTADIADQWLKKGSVVLVEGKIKTTKYTDKNGVEKYSTNINALSIMMLDKKEADTNEDRGNVKAISNNDFTDDLPF